ncbi:MAG: response regulator transcription factor [Chloroflexi bacterium]|nr:response regulator transcription factor [Chloroflexota bacterium]MBI3339625.1 response regulator transcription factor [Chloroflexota bacterium]
MIDAPSPAMRVGLRALLSSDETISIADEINAADVVITTSAALASLPDELTDSAQSASILFLSGAPLNVRALKRLRRAWGILPLDASTEELLAAVHALSQGLIVGDVSLLFPNEDETSDRGPLTERESEVINLLAKGMANKQIAVALNISEHTVKFHVSSIYAKLNVTNRTEAVREGLRAGLIAL